MFDKQCLIVLPGLYAFPIRSIPIWKKVEDSLVKRNVLPSGHVAKHCLSNNFFATSEHFFNFFTIFGSEILLTFRPWQNDQTLFVQTLRFALQEMFSLWPRHKTLLDKHKYSWFAAPCLLEKFKNIFCLSQTKNVWQAMFCDWPNIGKTFSLARKFQVFDEQCLINLPEPYFVSNF